MLDMSLDQEVWRAVLFSGIGRGGATVSRVGDILCEWREQKILLCPPKGDQLVPPWGDFGRPLGD